jgi:hypothetical protein
MVALPPEVRDLLRQLADITIQRLGVLHPSDVMIADEMRVQFGALAPSVVTAADPIAALQQVATRLLQELREN